MTPTHYTAKVLPDGHLPLPKEFPVHAGDEVEVTLVPVVPTSDEAEMKRKNMKGSVLRYDDPFGPAVPPEDWEALS